MKKLYTPQFEAYFRSKLHPTASGCLEWSGSRGSDAYGRVQVVRFGLPVATHRIAWEIEHNEIVPSSLMVCHRCDNPPCCNPEHLFLGTALDNSQDKIAKGRARGGHLCGLNNCRGKLTDANSNSAS